MTATLKEISALYEKYVMETYARADILFVRGEGTRLYDAEGREYLDFAAGIAVCSLGHCHPSVTKAIQEQAGKLVHTSNLYLNEWQPRLAQKLVEHGFDGVCFFANSGAEANEGLIKLARKAGNEKGRYEIIAMNDSFHGRTLATLAATGRAKYRKGFQPDMPGFKFVDYNDIDAVRNAVDDKTAAVLVEPVQGEGGVIPACPEYLKALRALCDEKGILLLFDEVQCGVGRTGTFFAWQNSGVAPDALSMAKALGNGFPIGAMLASRKYAGVLTPGTHASTFGGTPLACAASCAVIDSIDREKILENVKIRSAFLMEKLRALASRYSCIKGVRGTGLLIGVVLDFPAGELLSILRSKGMIALSAGETVLRLVPPLTVSQADCEKAVALIDEAFAQLTDKS
ncbi:MAG: Acetylornithine aminotransferase [Lentisphaerae bacterium ADurb.Bin242]|nr:MAG: Acetylornithine aminotransferase [Lentisphaerae bacterium ADurb.Bin242]